jgi:transposase-like protein
MVAVLCRCCQSERLIKDGWSAQGKQRYRCRSCGRRSCESPMAIGLSTEKEAQILAALNERMSLRGIARTFKVSRNTITDLLKKRHLDAPGAGT